MKVQWQVSSDLRRAPVIDRKARRIDTDDGTDSTPN
jgi:hypothetical protein